MAEEDRQDFDPDEDLDEGWEDLDEAEDGELPPMVEPLDPERAGEGPELESLEELAGDEEPPDPLAPQLEEIDQGPPREGPGELPEGADPLAAPQADLPMPLDLSLRSRVRRYDEYGQVGPRPERSASDWDRALASAEATGTPLPVDELLDPQAPQDAQPPAAVAAQPPQQPMPPPQPPGGEGPVAGGGDAALELRELIDKMDQLVQIGTDGLAALAAIEDKLGMR